MRLSFILVLLVFTSCKINSIKKTDVQQIKIQNILDELVVTNEIPGLNFSYINASGKQFDFSSGIENTTTQNKLNTSHKMFSGSVGKIYAAALVLQLVAEGKIKLADKIIQHLPKEDWLERIPNIKEVTIKMLLSHTSGLPRWVMKPEVWQTLKEQPNKVWSYKDRLSFIFDEAPVHAPGNGWAYSDTNYILLGWLIESVTNKDYYEILQSKILQPYQLNNTLPATKRKIEKLAMGYSELPETFYIPKAVINAKGEYAFNPQMEWTGGGIVSTTSDLAKWGKLYFTGDVISKELRQTMTQVTDNGKNVMADTHSYGMGCFIYTTKHGVAYGHSGFMPGYNTIVAYYPALEVTLALQSNCDYATKKTPLTEYLDQILDGILFQNM